MSTWTRIKKGMLVKDLCKKKVIISYCWKQQMLCISGMTQQMAAMGVWKISTSHEV